MRTESLVLALALAISAGAQVKPDNPSKQEDAPHGRRVQFAVGPRGVGEAFEPSIGKPGTWPGIVLVAEESGANNLIRQQAAFLSSKGYLVIAVDLYHGAQPVDLTNYWSRSQAIEDLQGAMSWLQNWMMDPTKVGAVSWGKNAQLSIGFAKAENNLKALVINAELSTSDSNELSKLQVPVLANLTTVDSETSPSSISSPSRKGLDIKTYTGLVQDSQDTSSPAFSAADASDVETRTLNFLDKNLKNAKRLTAEPQRSN
jgi:carboxymethylenebutenolidase